LTKIRVQTKKPRRTGKIVERYERSK